MSGDAQVAIGIDPGSTFYAADTTVQIEVIGAVIDRYGDIQLIDRQDSQRRIPGLLEALFVFADSLFSPQVLVGLHGLSYRLLAGCIQR